MSKYPYLVQLFESEYCRLSSMHYCEQSPQVQAIIKRRMKEVSDGCVKLGGPVLESGGGPGEETPTPP